MDDQDAIAIVGVGCRFPGAQNLDEFWDVLKNGENHVIEVPKDRWNVDAFYDSDPDAPGKTYVRKVGIVKDHESFDNRLFDINDIEASKMDPQQRFILESTFMALEDGGFPRRQLNGSNTGVYIGLMNTDYTSVLAADINQVDNYTLTGGAASIAAARVSYVFNLLGPALAVDTACSSALVAIHLASQALTFGDCDMAICGGANSVMLPSIMVPLSKARMVSPSGASRAFSAEADGYARGEGGGIVILKRLADAKANGDRIWSVIKTASNQDGRMASPITAPSGQQQQALLKETYTRYGINPADVQYIEAHGTGTPVGDPIEANSLGNFFGQDGSQRFIGSVKTNIGHLESAAGIAGLIKVLLMMKHATIVPSLHFTSPNPKIEFEKFKLTVPVECHPWETLSDGTRVACVNSFGFGGSNAHAVVIQNPLFRRECVKKSPGHTVVAVSGFSKQALRANVNHTLENLSLHNVDSDLLSYTSTCRRDHYPYRVAVAVADGEDLETKLKDVSAESPYRKNVSLVFVFGGMGTCWNGMCQNLLKDDNFLKAIRNIDNLLRVFSDISVESEIRSQQNLNNPIVGPLMLFACQVGLFSVWKAWGMKPNAIVGQSVGEVAAAYASGRINLEDAVRIIFHRTQLLSTVTGGQMLVILNYQVSEVEQLCSQFEGRLNIAVYYSPTACSISGDEECVQAVRNILEEYNKNSEKPLSMIQLKVTTAFHSQRMDSLTTPLVKKLHHLTACTEEFQIYSSVSGNLADKNDFVTPEYWAQNLRQPVLFYQAIKAAKYPDYHTVFIEIGPKPILAAHFHNIFEDNDVMLLPSMEKGSDLPCLLNSLCQLYSMGLNPAWEQIVPQYEGQLSDEPRYIFQRTKALFEPDISKNRRNGLNENDQNHPFVKRVPGQMPTFSVAINEQQTPFVFEHMVGGINLIPGTFYAEVALAVGSLVMELPPYSLTVSAFYVQPFSIQRGQGDVLTCQVQSLTSTGFKFVVFKQRVIYAHGWVNKREHGPPIVTKAFNKIQPRCDMSKNKTQIYKDLADWNLEYGDGLRIVQESFASSTESFSTIVTSDLIDAQLHHTHFHPSVLDAMTQSLGPIEEEGETPSNCGKPVLPAGLGSVSIFQPLEKKMISYGKVMEAKRNKAVYNMLLLSMTGVVIAEVKNFLITVVGEISDEAERFQYNLDWAPVISLEQQVEKHKRHVLTIIGEDSLKKAIMSSSDGIDFVICGTAGERLDFNEFKQTLFHHIDNLSGIIFNQCQLSTCQRHSTTGDDIFVDLCNACNDLRELLLILSENDLTIPVTVLTRSTQSLPCKTWSDNSVNIFGCQFWGMVRCLLKEGFYPFVQLIDIADDSEATISTLMSRILDTSTPSKEIAIAKGQAYAPVLAFARESFSANGAVEQTWNSNGDVRVIKTPRNSYLKHDFYVQPVDKIQRANGMSEILVKEILLHKEEVFPPTASCETEVWDNIKQEHAQLICLEAQGFNARTKEEVVACLPMFVSNKVSVPSECLIPLSAIPCYRIGLLTQLCFVWNIYDKINHQNNVVIVTDDVTADLGQITNDILRLCGITRSVCISTSDVTNVDISEATSVLLFGDLEPRVRHQLLSNNQLYEILAFKGCRGDTTLQQCYVPESTLNVIRIPPKQILAVSQMKVTVAHVSKLLSAKHKDFSELFKGLKDSHFVNISRGSLNLQNNSNLKMLTSSECLFRPNASYLVVGGLGGLGWLTVCLIAEKGGGLVATISRRPPSKEMDNKISDLKERTGVHILCLQADICDKVSLAKALNNLNNSFPRFPLRGVFQGAGILDDAFLMRMSKDKFDGVCKPKILGTVNLHELTESLNIDYFVMHSSIASIAGNAGQSNYGAGNSFMDTFAHYRRSKGLAGQSINWGPLEVGMALHNDQIAVNLEKSGFVSLSEKQIKKCLVNCLLSNTEQVCFMDFNWMEKNRYLYLSPDVRPVMETGGRDLDLQDSNSMQIDIQALKQKVTSERQATLYEYMKQVISAVVTVDVDDLSPATVVSSLGLDSMLAMTLANQIGKDLHVRLPVTKILEDSSVEMLVTFLDSSIMTEKVTRNNKNHAIQQKNVVEMSVLQEMVYETHMKWKGVRDYVFGVEIHFTTPVPFDWIKEVIISLLQRNPSLHTVYNDNGDTRRAEIREGVSDVEIMTIESLDSLDDLTKEITKVSKIPFDLSKEFPLRIICAKVDGNFKLGFIFHSISFDLKSLNLFFLEFSDIASAKLNGDILPPRNYINVAQVMTETLNSTINELQQFWLSKINEKTNVPQITFAGVHPPPPEVLSGSSEQISENITKDLRNGIDRFLSKFNVTLFQFLASVYHLLLHLVSGQTTLALKTSVDTRMHMPTLNNVIDRCVNAVPLIASFHPKDPIQTFVVSNAKTIMESVSMGMYPYNWIMKNATEETASNIARHAVVSEDMTNSTQTHEYANLKIIGNLNTNHETRLLIWSHQNRKNIRIQLDYLPDVLSSDKAKSVINSYFSLLRYIVTNSHCLIKDIPMNLYNKIQSTITGKPSVDDDPSLIHSQENISDMCGNDRLYKEPSTGKITRANSKHRKFENSQMESIRTDSSEKSISDRLTGKLNMNNSEKSTSDRLTGKLNMDNSEKTTSDGLGGKLNMDNSEKTTSDRLARQLNMDNSEKSTSDRLAGKLNMDNSEKSTSDRLAGQLNMDQLKVGGSASVNHVKTLTNNKSMYTQSEDDPFEKIQNDKTLDEQLNIHQSNATFSAPVNDISKLTNGKSMYSDWPDTNTEVVQEDTTRTATSGQLDQQLKAVLSSPITKMKIRPHVDNNGVRRMFNHGSYFTKATKQGWEHRVYLKLDKSTSSIKWGQREGDLTKQLPLKAITKINLNYINGEYVLIPKTRTRRFYFKTADGNLAKDWMLGLRKTLDSQC